MKRNARRMATALTLAWALALPVGAAAVPSPAAPEVPVKVLFNGFPAEVRALARDGVTYVPAEELLEAIGGPVYSYDGEVFPGGLVYRWAEDGSPTLTARLYDKEYSLTAGENGSKFRDGVLWAPLRATAEALGYDVVWSGTADLSRLRTRVTVDHLEDLLNAVGPDTEITLAPGEYSFAGVDPLAVRNPYVELDRSVFDTAKGDSFGEAWQAVIHDVRDLRINAANCRVATPWAYADVWRFRDCRRVTVEGGTAVHDVAPGHCQGNCAEFEDCRDVLLSNVTLDGSGAYGLCAYDSQNVILADSAIQNCTYGAASLWGCEDVELTRCTVRSLTDGYHLLDVSDSAGVRFTECAIEDTSSAALAETHNGSRQVVFDRCAFSNSHFGTVNQYGWQGPGGAVLLDCTEL